MRLWFQLSALLALAVSLAAAGTGAAASRPPLLRVQLELAPGARLRPHLLLMTLGGPVYCGQLLPLARYLDASLLCPDFGRNGETSGLTRSKRVEDWGDPAYLSAVARLPARFEARGLKVSGLVLVGASYAGYANAELVATHPSLRPRALIVVDSFLDLPERYRALPLEHETRAEIARVLGGTLGQRPQAYTARSPSGHLDGIAAVVRSGMRFVDVWSVAPTERREFDGATCSRAANAQWLTELASLLGRPVVGYVTHLEHADALRSWWRELLAFAGLGRPYRALPATAVTFRPGAAIPSAGVCG